MMKSYIWRKNFSAIAANQEMVIRGKLAFKTEVIHWLDTESPVIIPISLHSAFHEGLDGELKMNAFISTIKNHVKGQITILFTERAHLKVASLKYGNNDRQAFHECFEQAQRLAHRFRDYFESCHVTFWNAHICADPSYSFFYQQVTNRYMTDIEFRNLVNQDAETTYTRHRADEFPDKKIFVNRAVEDILEQCISLLVIAHQGYRFQFYPGSSFASTDYVNHHLLPTDKQISYINVFLTIEKKTITYK